MLTFLAEAASRSSVLILAVWVLLKLSRTRDPGTEKLAWTLALAASLAMPLLTWSWDARTMPLDILSGRVSASMSRLADLPRANHGLSAAILAGYVLGLAAFATRLVAGLRLGFRLRRGAHRTSMWGNVTDVRLSAEVQVPVSFGSTVLLPADCVTWDQRTVSAVLAHEREHIRNGDCYRLWLALLCRAVFWFNPLVHWLHYRLTILTELTSDAAGLLAAGDRSSYITILLQLATGTSMAPAVVPMARRSTLPGRLRHLLSGDERLVEVSLLRKALMAVGVLLLGAALSAQARKQPALVLAPFVKAKITYAPDPNDFYPEALRRHHEQGDGRIQLCIDRHGHVSANVARSTGDTKLDDQMLKIANSFRFQPATRGGRPVRSCLSLPVKFVLRYN